MNAQTGFPSQSVQAVQTSSPLSQRFHDIRKQTEKLIAPLSAEDCQLQSMPDASPAKWHLAHLTWFFETFILERFERDFQPFDPAFRVLFNSYYTGVGERYPRPKRGLVSKPGLDEVLTYRREVDERMQSLMGSPAFDSDIELAKLIELGLQHEQQHQELLLTDIKHAWSYNPLRPAYGKRWPLSGIRPQPQRWLGFEGGLIRHGFDSAVDDGFAFDNETPQHSSFLDPFELSSRLVTNGDYRAFIDDGGYDRPDLWLSMGWDWAQAGAHRAPLYWYRDDSDPTGSYQNFTLQGLVEVDPNTPVCHLSFFEADAFARWAGARLPTEQEWECAARSLPATHRTGNFVEGNAYHPLPLSGALDGAPAQMFGDVWEWTQSNYNPYPRYKPWEGLVGEYNGKFMCNQFVLRGGSCATPKGHIRASYRNFFPPDAQWQFSGLRLARDK